MSISTVTPAPTSTQAAVISSTSTFTPCLVPVQPPPPAQPKPVQLVYSDEGKLWLWQEETRAATPFPLPDEATEARLSADGQLIAFLRPVNDQESGIWVINHDGSEARKLTTVSITETLQHYPHAVAAQPYYTWVQDSHTIAYGSYPIFDALGEVPLEAVHLVEADTGKARVVIPPGEVNALTYAPDGSQIAALTAEELRLIDTGDGQVQFAIPLPLTNLRDQSLAYSPNGQHLVVFTTAGITIINPTTGSQRDVPLAYKPIGLGHTSATPAILWLKDTPAFYTLIANNEDVFAPKASFTVWKINVAEATAIPLHTFTGLILAAEFSPDLRRLVFWTQQPNNDRQLYLADVGSDQQILYEHGHLIEFLDWSPDSTRFVYWFFKQKQLHLGHICQPPVSLDTPSDVSQIQWIDATRLLLVTGESGKWELWLHSLGGESILITTVYAESLDYRVYFDE